MWYYIYIYTAAVYAPREKLRKRGNEAARGHLKELQASIPQQPRRPSLELLEVEHLPPEAELLAVRDYRVAKRRRGLARCQGLARRQASWALPTCDMPRPVIPHMVWHPLCSVLLHFKGGLGSSELPFHPQRVTVLGRLRHALAELPFGIDLQQVAASRSL